MVFNIGDKVTIKSEYSHLKDRFDGRIGEIVSFHPKLAFLEIFFSCMDKEKVLGRSSFYFDLDNLNLYKPINYHYVI